MISRKTTLKIAEIYSDRFTFSTSPFYLKQGEVYDFLFEQKTKRENKKGRTLQFALGQSSDRRRL